MKPKILSTFLQQSWFPVLESTTAVVVYTNNPLKLLVQIRNRIGMQKVHSFVLEDASWLLYAMTQFHISPSDMEGMHGRQEKSDQIMKLLYKACGKYGMSHI
jgi:hypothetical protein